MHVYWVSSSHFACWCCKINMLTVFTSLSYVIIATGYYFQSCLDVVNNQLQSWQSSANLNVSCDCDVSHHFLTISENVFISTKTWQPFDGKKPYNLYIHQIRSKALIYITICEPQNREQLWTSNLHLPRLAEDFRWCSIAFQTISLLFVRS